MSSEERSEIIRSESPDPSSHAINVYDTEMEGEWPCEDNDLEPTTDEDSEFFDPNEEAEEAFHGSLSELAGLGGNGVEIEFSMDEPVGIHGQDEDDTETEAPQRRTRPVAVTAGRGGAIQVSHAMIMRLFGRRGDSIGLQLLDGGDEERVAHGSQRRRRTKGRAKLPPVPSEEGERLMADGTFGETRSYEDKLGKRTDRLARRLMYRELGVSMESPTRCNKLISQGLIPSSNADTIIHYDARCYSGQFSDDGNFFFSCAQDFKVRMYDTSNPYNWKYYKTALYPYGQWTITDASLTPDNKFLAYSSIRSIVCLASTDPTLSDDSPLFMDFADTGRQDRYNQFAGYSGFGIWSIRFSGDGREVVAGTSENSIYVYDIEAKKSVLRIAGHTDDVNAVCFGDNSSPHILYSGSDDTLIKVWDRRSMGDSREAGVFMGHTEGLTYVDSKGDGRYVLSNGKDQCMKLWDLRKMMSTDGASKHDPSRYSTGFDYRFMSFSEAEYEPHPHDCSLVTFRGHRVLKTLIRCHFSPPGSTDSRYVYSGSDDGSVYVYNMDATLAGKINVNKATYHSRPKDPDLYNRQYEMRSNRDPDAWKTCVRDASWHPNAPVVAATSWNGWGLSTGTCTTHSWNDGAEEDEGEPKMGLRVNQRLEEDKDLYDRPQQPGRISQFRSRLRGQLVRAADDDDGW
ncbi:MAG: hypothetical protein Q9184_000459 [Pyrenodesmia sp. 2 TL-2023]